MNLNVTSNVNQSILPCEEPIDLSCRFNRMTENVLMNPDSLPLTHPVSDQYSPLSDGRVTITNPKISSTVTAGMSNDPTFQALSVSGSRSPNNQEKTDKKVEVYFCNVCRKTFGKKYNLTRHMKMHAKNRLYPCSICDKSFVNKFYLKQHINTHIGKKTYFCKICENKSFLTKGTLEQHMTLHAEKKPYFCDKCGKGFTRKASFNQHMIAHSEKKTYHCCICDKGLRTIGNLNRHMKVHLEEKYNPCSICGKKIVSKNNLKLHMKTHIGEKLYSCSTCTKTFKRKHNLTQHMNIHIDKKPYKFSICDKQFNHNSNLKTHIMQIHAAKGQQSYASGRPQSPAARKPLEFSCRSNRMTENVWMNPDSLRPLIHPASDQYSPLPDGRVTITNPTISSVAIAGTSNDPTFQALSVSGSRNPNNRKKTDKKVKVYSCEICGKGFENKYHLRRHRIVHVEEKAYSCKVCGKGLKREDSFWQHMKSHTEERLYPCSFCSKRFITISCLNRHIQTHTKGAEKKDKPCEICGKILAKTSSLKAHMKIHTREKVYCSSVCYQRFEQKDQLITHISTHAATRRNSYACGRPQSSVASEALDFFCPRPNRVTENVLMNPDNLPLTHSVNDRYSQLPDGRVVITNSKISSAATAGASNDPTFQATLSVSGLRSPNNQEKTHKMVKFYFCEVCGKRVTTKNNLSEHMRTS